MTVIRMLLGLPDVDLNFNNSQTVASNAFRGPLIDPPLIGNYI